MTKRQHFWLKILKKSLSIPDRILLVMWAFSLPHLNYSQLSTFNKFSLVVFVLWFSTLIAEIYKNYRNIGGRR